MPRPLPLDVMRDVLSLMVWLTLAYTSASADEVRPARSPESWELDYAILLERYATPGGVRYQSWHRNPADLRKLSQLVDEAGRFKLPPGNSPSKKAFLINAYNLWVLHGVLQSYPIRSVQEIAPDFGFFSENRITLEGRPVSLNHMEKDLLLREFADPRLHFAVNCASRSCPPLIAKPFRSETLDIQLDRATRQFLEENPEGVRISADGRSVGVSAIFDWYAADFQSSGGVEAFIRNHRKNPFPPGSRITHLTYDWALNEAVE